MVSRYLRPVVLRAALVVYGNPGPALAQGQTLRQMDATGKAGLFGLRGLRDRAERIGGTFTLETASGTGTSIAPIVPGRMAFRSARETSLAPIRRQ